MTTHDNARTEIDAIDQKITGLFERRMALTAEIAAYKKENGLPILDTAREREIISRITREQDDEMAEYTKVLFTTLFDVSRSYQGRGQYDGALLAKEISSALEATPKTFPQSAVVACQGIEGSNSQYACERLFSRPSIMYFNSFDAVFSAVDKGLCGYGILPVENSIHGSVNEVYDLMRKYRFHISKVVRLQINHALLTRHGVELKDIKEIYSHEQALGQCDRFLNGLKGVKVTSCENTAIAAKNVSTSERNDAAAISTRKCAELYNLKVLSDDIQNGDNNYTLFICISKKMEIYPGADKVSVMLTIPHKTGSLYGVISKFAALGINISKLESRPMRGKNFEFMFYIDFEASVYRKEILNLLCQLESSLDFFAFLGAYCEV